MEPRRGLSRARRTTTSARSFQPQSAARRNAPAPYVVGEDILASAAPPPPTTVAARARDGSRRAAGRVRHPQPAASAQSEYGVGDEALAPGAALRMRWRRPTARPAALAGLARGLGAGASAVARQRKRLSPGRILSSGASLALLGALLFWLFVGSYWQTRSVRVQGTNDPTLLALAHAQRLTGCNAFRCDFSAARRAIGASPRVQRVSVTVVFPDTTLVNITPRQTVALWRTQGLTWAVGADGVIIGALQREPALAVNGATLVDDPDGAAFAGREPQPGARMDAALVAMARQLRVSATGAGLDATSLRYSSVNGFTMRASGMGALVVFGAPADAQATLADLVSVSPAPAPIRPAQVTTAQVAAGAKMQVEAAGAILAQLARGGASATLIDVRWGGHSYYR